MNKQIEPCPDGCNHSDAAHEAALVNAFEQMNLEEVPLGTGPLRLFWRSETKEAESVEQELEASYATAAI